jgi:hemerythrin
LTWDTAGLFPEWQDRAKSPAQTTGSIVLPLPSHLSVGIPSIDDQHQSLLDQLHKLFSDPEDHPDSAAFSEALSRLSGQLIDHFTSEEQVMRTLGLPPDMLARHMDDHNRIIEQITQLSFDLMQQRQIKRTTIVARVKDWVLGHLTEHDLQLRNWKP